MAVKGILCWLAVLLFVSLAAAEERGDIPSFHIQPGDAVRAEVRLFPTAAPQLRLVIGQERAPGYELFIRENVGRITRIYVCGQLLTEGALPETYARSEFSFFISPQQGLDLAVQLVKKTEPERRARE